MTSRPDGTPESSHTAAARPSLVWLVPGDKGGGVVWVADSCCRQAAAAGYDVTLLTMTPLSEATMARIGYKVVCMHETPPYTDTPRHFVDWVIAHKPGIVFINGCDTMDDCAPYLPAQTRCVYAVHDTPSFYWKAAIKHEDSLDAIFAVSELTAATFRGKLRSPEKLHVTHNGTQFPALSKDVAAPRGPDICFLGGDTPRKGADDVLAIWPHLIQQGYQGTLHWFGRMAPEFKASVERLPAAHQIVLHGHRTRAELFQCLEASSAILVPSRSEAFGLVLVEAMSMGCVPVTWDIPETATDEIVPPDCRFSAPFADYAQAARVTLAAIEARGAIASALANEARTQFSEAAMWARYETLIHHIMMQPRARRDKAGQTPPAYRPPVRATHMIPKPLWNFLRPRLARSAHLFRALRKRL